MTATFADSLRHWRSRRGMSQLDLALAANVSQRHVSFLETGRAQPSRPMVIGLAEAMSVPLAGRNAMLGAAGFSPHYRQSPLDDAALREVRTALDLLLSRHMPYPAVLIDRYWNLIDGNKACAAVFGLHPQSASEPINLPRMIAANPALTDRFENWPEVAHHLLARLRTEHAASGGDPALAELIDVLKASPVFGPAFTEPPAIHPFIPTRLRHEGRVLSFFSVISHFGTATDITVSDLRLEFSMPADRETDRAMQEMFPAG